MVLVELTIWISLTLRNHVRTRLLTTFTIDVPITVCKLRVLVPIWTVSFRGGVYGGGGRGRTIWSGRPHARSPVLKLVRELDVRIPVRVCPTARIFGGWAEFEGSTPLTLTARLCTTICIKDLLLYAS